MLEIDSFRWPETGPEEQAIRPEEKGDSPHWCEAPSGRAPTEGWSRQMGAVPFFPEAVEILPGVPCADQGVKDEDDDFDEDDFDDDFDDDFEGDFDDDEFDPDLDEDEKETPAPAGEEAPAEEEEGADGFEEAEELEEEDGFEE